MCTAVSPEALQSALAEDGVKLRHGVMEKKFRCPLLCINLLAAASIFPLIAALCNRLSVGHDKLCFESRAEGLMSEFQVARSKSAEYNCSVSIAEPCRANQV